MQNIAHLLKKFCLTIQEFAENQQKLSKNEEKRLILVKNKPKIAYFGLKLVKFDDNWSKMKNSFYDAISLKNNEKTSKNTHF